MHKFTDDTQLYAACCDEGSLQQVDAFEQLWAALYRRAYALLHDRADADHLAADCTQSALIKIHRNLAQCREPQRFRAWTAQILRRSVIDLLRRPDQRNRSDLAAAVETPANTPPPDAALSEADLQQLLRHAISSGGLSDRSQRVVVGRFFQEQSDEALALAEQSLSGGEVRPSHVQVTRAKNLAKLRADSALLDQLRALLAP